MWNNSKTYFTILVSLAILLASCRSRKNIIKDIEAADIQAQTEASEVIDSVRKSKFDFEWLSAIIRTKYETSKGESKSFKTYLKIRKDSAIFSTITYLNIPVLSTLITPDSVKVMDKTKKRYFIGSSQSVGDYFKVPVDFYNIQNLLVGNAISLDSNDKHYLARLNDDVYLSSVKNSELPAILSGEKVYFGWMYRYWINEYYKPGKTILDNPGKGSSLEIVQDDYIKIDDVPFPNHTNAVFSNPTDTFNIKLNYNRVKINKPFEFKFNIPSKYEPFE